MGVWGLMFAPRFTRRMARECGPVRVAWRRERNARHLALAFKKSEKSAWLEIWAATSSTVAKCMVGGTVACTFAARVSTLIGQNPKVAWFTVAILHGRMHDFVENCPRLSTLVVQKTYLEKA